MTLDDQINLAAELLEKYAKKCINCGATKLTTRNNEWPLKHRCLACGADIIELQNGEMKRDDPTRID
jgi:DNA-directed RNA polymerase subunit RPC12/RpoP